MNLLSLFVNFPTLLVAIFLGCDVNSVNNEKITGYNLSIPDAAFTFPEILHEVSGLTYVDSTSFACVQDEKGIIFIYDVFRNKIKAQYSFNMDGDYEGIARVGKTIYVLRSDGTLFEISDYRSKNFKLNSFVTGIPANNNEGLCYDAENNRLLIACKGKIGKGPEFKDKRVIYGFSLKTKTLTKEPVYDFSLQAIQQFAETNNIKLPTRKKKNGEVVVPLIKFRASAICIHPITQKLFLLSASDHMLFVFNRNGKIEHLEQLDLDRFNKAEGIAFFDN